MSTERSATVEVVNDKLARDPDARGAPTRAGKLVSGSIEIKSVVLMFFSLVVFLAVGVFALAVPNPSPNAAQTFRIILSLGAAGLGGMLPGVLSVRVQRLAGAAISSTGAGAFFIVIYFWAPAFTPAVASLKFPPTPAEPEAQQFLDRVKAGNLTDAWNMMDQSGGISLAEFKEIFSADKMFGHYSIVRLKTVTTARNPPGESIGLYKQLIYVLRTDGKAKCITQSVTLKAGGDLTWRVYSFSEAPTSEPCS